MQRSLKPRPTLDAQNARNLYADIAWFGVLSGISGSFLSVFVLRAGGSDFHVGLLSALPALVTFLASIPGSRLVEHENKPLSVLIATAILSRLGYLAIALSPLFLAAKRADVIVAIVGLMTVPTAVFNVAFTTMFGQAVKPRDRAHVVSIRNVWVGITSTAIAFIGGKFLDHVMFPVNYQLLFVIGFAASMASVYHLARIRLAAEPATAATRAAGLPGGVRDWVKMLSSSRPYVRFSLSSFFFHWGGFFAIPLYSIYWVRVLKATDGWVGLLSMVGSATTIVFYPLWGRLTMRRGNACGVLLAALGLAVYPLATMLSPSVEWIILVQILGGATTSGYGLAFFNRLLEVSPEQHRPSFIAAYHTLINIAMFASPLLSTSLSASVDIRALLLAGAAMRFLGALSFGSVFPCKRDAKGPVAVDGSV
jgi:MFS family permease